MGAHKYNPTAIAAKNGELPPKKHKISTAELQRIVIKEFYKNNPFYKELNGHKYLENIK